MITNQTHMTQQHCVHNIKHIFANCHEACTVSDYDLNKCLFYSSTTDKHSTKLNKTQQKSTRQDAHDFSQFFITLDVRRSCNKA